MGLFLMYVVMYCTCFVSYNTYFRCSLGNTDIRAVGMTVLLWQC